MRILIIALIALIPLTVFAQEPVSVEDSIEEIKSDLDSIKNDLEDVKEALRFILQTFRTTVEERKPTKEVSFESDSSSKDDYVLGDKDAEVTMLFYLDFQCGFTSRFYKTTFNKIKRDYIDHGKLKVIFRDLPGEEHPMAAPAASIASCAGKQGKYMQAADALFYNPDKLLSGDIKGIINKNWWH